MILCSTDARGRGAEVARQPEGTIYVIADRESVDGQMCGMKA